jgi:predicted DNA-binding ArsR family transcriptional regulator
MAEEVSQDDIRESVEEVKEVLSDNVTSFREVVQVLAVTRYEIQREAGIKDISSGRHMDYSLEGGKDE